MAFSNQSDPTFPPVIQVPPYRIWKDWCIGDSLEYINANSLNFDSRIENVSSLVLAVSSYAVGLSARNASTLNLNFNNRTNILSGEVPNNSLGTIKLGGDILQSGKALLTAASLSALRDVFISGLAINHTLVWAGSGWNNQPAATGGGSTGVSNGDKGDIQVSGTPEGTTWLLDTTPGSEAVQTTNTRDGAMTPAKLSTGRPYWSSTSFVGVGIDWIAPLSDPNARLTVGSNLAGTAASKLLTVNGGSFSTTTGTTSALASFGVGTTVDTNASLGIKARRNASAPDNYLTTSFGITLDYENSQNVTQIWLRGDGNVGIGTPLPNQALTVAGSISATNQISGLTLRSTNSAGSEGGEMYLARPASGTSLAGDVTIDISANNLRIFEGGGTSRGVGLDLTGCASSAGSILLHSGNYNSYAPTLGGTGATGTWSISITGNAATAGGLSVHTSTNNEANKIVRTDSSGYIQAGLINTSSNDNGTTAIDRVYASSDSFIRYYTPANFRQVLDVPTRTGSNASGSWGINITGSSASCTGNAATATTAGNVTGTVALGNGGTGATTAATAASNLGLGTTNLVQLGSLGAGVAAPTSGKISALDDITAFASDKRLKTDINTLTNALDKVNSLTGFTYVFNNLGIAFGFEEDVKHVGIFAQDLQKVLPEAVKPAPFDTEYKDNVPYSKSGENYLTIQYEKIVPLLIEAIKELSQEVKELKNKTIL